MYTAMWMTVEARGRKDAGWSWKNKTGTEALRDPQGFCFFGVTGGHRVCLVCQVYICSSGK